ncbi:hypothetical protein SAMN04488505_102749 [Chitinophaga rupis]|uniref:CHAT domain-containing protein n=1 Tax=Chitinophaga rupis TaxID=573321 RepID=A0A1H7RXM0_9BACT|nr:hypothetical protein [Chitinophaga rupis]SEL64434.1 hypothetical protein SAMN04488505_102749 [Chitinophaga rupis]
MELSLTQLRNLLKSEPGFNPFSKEFAKDRLSGITNSYPVIERRAAALLWFVLTANDAYLQIIAIIEMCFDEIALPKEQLQTLFFLFANKMYFLEFKQVPESSVIEEYFEKFFPANNLVLFDAENVTEFGLHDIMQEQVELLEIIIPLISEWDINGLPGINEEFVDEIHIPDLMRTILLNADLIYRLKDIIYDKLVYGNYYIIQENSFNIKLQPEFPSREIIRYAANITGSNQRFAYGTFLMQNADESANNSKRIQGISAPDGFINLQVVLSGSRLIHFEVEATQKLYYEYLMHIPLSCFGNLNLQQLGMLFSLTAEIFNTLSATVDIDTPLGETPLYISENALLHALQECTGFNRNGINAFIHSLISNPDKPCFCNQPFFKIGNNLLVSLFAFYRPKIHLYFDRWMALEGLTDVSKNLLFHDYFIRQLSSKKPKYNFMYVPLSNDSGLDEAFKSNAIFSLSAGILFAQIVVYDYPADALAHEVVWKKLEEAGAQLQEKRALLKHYYGSLCEGKEINLVIVSNHDIFEGQNINGIPLTGPSAVYNYVHVGKFNNQVISGKRGNISSKTIADFHYYDTDSTFNKNMYFHFKSLPSFSFTLTVLKLTEASVLPASAPLKIRMEIVDFKEKEIQAQSQISELRNLLYYNYHHPDYYSSLLSTNIQIKLADFFYRITHAPYEIVNQRHELLNAIISSRITGIYHLNTYLFSLIDKIHVSREVISAKVNIKPSTTDAGPLLKKLQNYLLGSVDLPEIRIPRIFTLEEEEELISFVRDIMILTYHREPEGRDFQTIHMILVILYGLRDRHDTMDIFYDCCDRLLYLLNKTSQYERARSYCDDILKIALENTQHTKAWIILFNCYNNQMNTYEAAMYGSLFFTSLLYLDSVPYHLAFSGFYTLLEYSVNFDHYDMAIQVFEFLNTIALDEYNKDQVYTIYFRLLLMEVHRKPEKLDEIFQYLDEHIIQISSFHTSRRLRWLSVLYQLQLAVSLNFYCTDKNVDAYIKQLEEDIDPNKLEACRQEILGSSEKLKPLLIKHLLNSFETRSANVHVINANQMLALAYSVVRYALQTMDTEALLLAGLILCDAGFTYRPAAMKEFFRGADAVLAHRLNNYQQYVLSNIHLEKEQLLLWIFKTDHKVTCLIIDANRQIIVHQLPDWDLYKIDPWISDIKNFHFNAKNQRDYDLFLQEKDYREVKDLFAFTALRLPACDEIFICFSTELSFTPHNLLMSDDLLLAERHAVCNVISIEYFLHHHATVYLPVNYKISAWIPSDDMNPTISWGHNLLEPVLKEVNAVIYTERYPASPLSGDLNVFLAHGVRDLSGFKVVRTADTENSGIDKPGEIFGSSAIAILFICNAGSSESDLYARQITSFSGDLLKAGYQTVIAPYWPYDVTMSPRWLTTFIRHFNEGYTASQCAYFANSSLSTYDENTAQVFYAPQGRLAMHVYGNPNLRLNIP